MGTLSHRQLYHIKLKDGQERWQDKASRAISLGKCYTQLVFQPQQNAQMITEVDKNNMAQVMHASALQYISMPAL